MPDPILALKAGLAALGAAAILLLLGGALWRRPRPGLSSAVAALAVGAGLVLGWRVFGLWPHWPPHEDLDRFVCLLMPTAILIELIAAIPRLPRWLLRLSVAVGAGPGPDSPGWQLREKIAIFAGLALALAGNWAALNTLARRTSDQAVSYLLILCCAATAIVLMMSGYATGGPLGLPLAGALAGILLTSLVLPRRLNVTGAIGVGIVGLFGLIVIGYYFNELTAAHSLALFFAPLLGWLPELPGVRRINPRIRAVASVLLVTLPLMFVASRAWEEFKAKAAPSGSPDEITADDYK